MKRSGGKLLTGLAALVVAGACVATAGISHAAAAVVINEIMWDGSEYLELYNSGDDEASLDSWRIVRQQTDGAEASDIVTFSADDRIEGGGYFLVVKNESTVTGGYHKLAGSLTLHNEGDLLELRDGQDVAVDAANRFGSWFAGQNTAEGVAMERTSADTDGRTGSAWQDSTGSVGGRAGTPGAANSSGSTTNENPDEAPSKNIPGYSNEIVISEYLPNPAGEDTKGEYIELHNSGHDDADLSGWELDDGDTGSKKYKFSEGTVIAAQAYVAFYWNQTKLTLNNNGDQIILLSPDGAVRAQAQYSEVVAEGVSYNRANSGSYAVSTTLTPGAVNVISAPAASNSPVADETEAKKTIKSPTPSVSSSPAYTYSQKVFINEFMPNPDGEDETAEFIEIINLDNKPVDLIGWQVDDAEGGSKPYVIKDSLMLKPGGIVSLSRSLTGVALNNNSDEVRLIDPSGKVISSWGYQDAAAEGQSYIRNSDGEYEVSQSPTPGEANVGSKPLAGQVAGVFNTVPDLSDEQAPAFVKTNDTKGDSAEEGAAVPVTFASFEDPAVGEREFQPADTKQGAKQVKRVAGLVIGSLAIVLIVINVAFSGEPIWKLTKTKSGS